MEVFEQSPAGLPAEPSSRVPPLLQPRSCVGKLQANTIVSSNKNVHFDEVELEADDDLSQQMTASYSEISFKSDISPTEQELSLTMDPIPFVDEILQRPVTLSCTPNLQPFLPLDLEGSIHMEGNMTHFVAEDLEYKIKLSSPVSNKRETPSLSSSSMSATPITLFRQLVVPHVGAFDAGLLSELETEAQRMATSIDNLTENLCAILHSISSITADNVDIYREAVSKMSDSMDANIKSMYTMMAKAEEVTQTMKGVQVHATRIKEIKRLVDLFESYM